MAFEGVGVFDAAGNQLKLTSDGRLQLGAANGGATIATAQVSISTVAVIIAANTSRYSVVIKSKRTNTDTVCVGITGVTTANGHFLDPGETITFATTAAIYGVAVSGTQVLSTCEEAV